MRIRKTKIIWMLLKFMTFIAFGKYSLLCVEYSYFINSAPFPLDNATGILQELLVYGSTDATPINTIHLNSKLLYNSENTCKSKILLLIVVKSAVGHFGQRDSIRRTWGKWADADIKIVFMLGYQHSARDYVEQESNIYNDIVQGTFSDSYANNILKTIMAYNWISQFCSKTDFVLFVDDDFFVHIPNILKYVELNRMYKSENSMFGHLVYMARPIRQKESKWYISETEYSHDFWMPYLAGGSILTNIQVVKNISLAIPYVQYVWIDDSYIGMVASKINIKLIHESGFDFSCKVAPRYMKNYLSSHGYNDLIDFISAWDESNIYEKVPRGY